MKYRCDVCVEGYMTVEVEADSEDEATKKALEKFENECFQLPIGDLQFKTAQVELL